MGARAEMGAPVQINVKTIRKFRKNGTTLGGLMEVPTSIATYNSRIRNRRKRLSRHGNYGLIVPSHMKHGVDVSHGARLTVSHGLTQPEAEIAEKVLNPEQSVYSKVPTEPVANLYKIQLNEYRQRNVFGGIE